MTDAPLMSLSFSLPWPPSVNTYWRHIILGGKHKKARAQTLLSEQGRDYRVAAIAALRQAKVPVGALKGRLAVHAIAFPPDRRARDLDNLWKGVLDALKHAGTIVDDGDIDDLHMVRGIVRPGGLIELKVRELEHVIEVQPELFTPAPVLKKGRRVRDRRTGLNLIVTEGGTATLDGDPF